MPDMLIQRRNLLRGLFAAPAIIAIDRLMPVRAIVEAKNSLLVGYKGAPIFDAGLFYCPYIPLQTASVIDNETPIMFKTRYGVLVPTPSRIAREA